jgi:hypothetical protein
MGGLIGRPKVDLRVYEILRLALKLCCEIRPEACVDTLYIGPHAG